MLSSHLQEHQYHQIWHQFHQVLPRLKQSCFHTRPLQGSARFTSSKLSIDVTFKFRFFYNNGNAIHAFRFCAGFRDNVSSSFNLITAISRLHMKWRKSKKQVVESLILLCIYRAYIWSLTCLQILINFGRHTFHEADIIFRLLWKEACKMISNDF